MSIPLSKEREAEVVQSIVRFFGEKLDVEILNSHDFHEITTNPFARARRSNRAFMILCFALCNIDDTASAYE